MKKILLCLLLFNISLTAYSVIVSREISRSTIGNKQSAVVTVNINKAGIDGIAKLIEVIPSGFRAFVTNKGGGKVLLGEKGELKIVWLTLPVSEKIKVEYRLIHMGTSVGSDTIKGSFIYIQNDIREEKSIDPTAISVGNGAIEKEVISTPKIIAAIYKVQLGVFSEEKSLSVFKGLPDVHYSLINGFYKYFSGKFNTEAEAKKVIVEAKSKGFKGAFLVRVKK